MVDKMLIALIAKDYGITQKQAKELIKTYNKDILIEILM